MAVEQGRQLSYLELVEKPFKSEIILRGERTLREVLIDDFVDTLIFIRKIYLPENSILRANNWMLSEAMQIAREIEDLYEIDIKNEQSYSLSFWANLETLRRRQVFLNSSVVDSPTEVAFKTNTQAWENEIRLATDEQFKNIKTMSPEDKPKVTDEISSTAAIRQISTVFHQEQSLTTELDWKTEGLENRIAGEDRLSAELFSYYFSFLKKKSKHI